MIIGEIGPVEVELIFSLIFFFSGGFMGLDTYETPLSELTGYNNEFLTLVKLKHIIAVLICVLLVIFVIDNLTDALKQNATETLKLFMPVFILLAFAQMSS